MVLLKTVTMLIHIIFDIHIQFGKSNAYMIMTYRVSIPQELQIDYVYKNAYFNNTIYLCSLLKLKFLFSTIQYLIYMLTTLNMDCGCE